jgi:hypothetical protein
VLCSARVYFSSNPKTKAQMECTTPMLMHSLYLNNHILREDPHSLPTCAAQIPGRKAGMSLCDYKVKSLQVDDNFIRNSIYDNISNGAIQSRRNHARGYEEANTKYQTTRYKAL